jgi:hypothetical protein
LINDSDLKDIEPTGVVHVASADHVQAGLPIPKAARVRIFSPDDWEEFTQEWASSLKSTYAMVRRFAGSGDMGLDIAGFTATTGFAAPWDNFQCKRYDHALRPADIQIETTLGLANIASRESTSLLPAKMWAPPPQNFCSNQPS